jgi:hypothetical protein
MLEKKTSKLQFYREMHPQHNNQHVTIGTISAPSRFIEGEEDFDSSRRHYLVSKTDGVIKLILNEQSVTDKYIIQGKIEVAKKFTALGINNDKVSYEPEQLANKLKLCVPCLLILNTLNIHT